jgi:hypothetical protein
MQAEQIAGSNEFVEHVEPRRRGSSFKGTGFEKLAQTEEDE